MADETLPLLDADGNVLLDDYHMDEDMGSMEEEEAK